jgi:CRISPR/Cas system-associated exonuclease Cas4 (RecB family)
MQNQEIQKHKYFNYTDPAPLKATERSSKSRGCYVKPLKPFYDLLIQVGFNDYKKRREITNHIYENYKYKWYTINWEIKENDQPLNVLKSFLKDKQVIQTIKTRERNIKKTSLSASEISDYVFCPASFVIKRTYEIEPTEHMDVGTELHDKRYLHSFIGGLFNKRKRKYLSNITQEHLGGIVRGIAQFKSNGVPIDDISINDISQAEKRKILHGPYGDLLDSEIIFSGHSDENKTQIYKSIKGNLVGVPDYILEKPDGSKFIVEEKHTWNEVMNKPFPNHYLQTLAYLQLLYENQESIKNGYLMYFSWKWRYYKDEKYLTTQNTRLHRIKNNKKDIQKLASIFKEIKMLEKNGVKKFDNNNISTEKCFNCSARALCLHKNANLNKLNYPYNRLSA